MPAKERKKSQRPVSTAQSRPGSPTPARTKALTAQQQEREGTRRHAARRPAVPAVRRPAAQIIPHGGRAGTDLPGTRAGPQLAQRAELPPLGAGSMIPDNLLTLDQAGERETGQLVVAGAGSARRTVRVQAQRHTHAHAHTRICTRTDTHTAHQYIIVTDHLEHRKQFKRLNTAAWAGSQAAQGAMSTIRNNLKVS